MKMTKTQKLFCYLKRRKLGQYFLDSDKQLSTQFFSNKKKIQYLLLFLGLLVWCHPVEQRIIKIHRQLCHKWGFHSSNENLSFPTRSS